MAVTFERVAVLGLGLLGGSLALAAKQRGVARQVVGSGRRRAALERAVADGVIDEIVDVADAGRDADLLVLATPVVNMPEQLRATAASLAQGSLVTDVGSVKAVLAETLPGLLGPGIQYVGSHPMAGSHLRGVEHARADLFEDSVCVVTPTAEPAAVERIADFWQALGARVVFRDPVQHDQEVGWVSHVPHVLAFAFAHALADASAAAGEVRGTGFRDFTRIAHSDPELWSEILTANRKAIEGPLHSVQKRLAQLSSALESGDSEAVTKILAEAREALAQIEIAAGKAGRKAARSGGENPEIPTSERGRERRS